MRNLDFSSLHALITTLLSLAVITLLGVGIRLLTQFTIQQRRERMNRQINERLRALIAAYKTLGGSFTGDLTVNPTHRRDLRHDLRSDLSRNTEAVTADAATTTTALDLGTPESPGSDRARRIRSSGDRLTEECSRACATDCRASWSRVSSAPGRSAAACRAA